VSHDIDAIFPGIIFSLALIGYFALLWRWRTWYAATSDVALARRSMWAVTGVSLLFLALWLTCGRVSMNVMIVKWAIPPMTLLGIGCLLKSAAGATTEETA
jgi:hypothetical protein